MKPAILALLLATSVAADELPAFQPTPGPIGEIRIWGSPEDGKLLAEWQTGFRKYHPDAVLKTELHGPDSTMAGLYAGVADLSFLSREMRQPVERMAFEWEYHHPAAQIPVANGGLTHRPSAALAVFVSKKNGLSDVTLAQLKSLFGSGDARVYGPSVDSVGAAFFRNRVLNGSYKWSAGYQTIEDDGARLAKLADDPDAIALAPVTAANDGVRMLSIAGVLPEPANLVSHAYPLWRSVAMVANPPASPKVKEFLRYVLSREGQSALRDYLPLSAESAKKSREALEVQTIRIWGHGSYDPSIDFMGVLVKDWEAGFQKLHPEIRFENRLDGTAAAVGAVYSGAGDLALMGREIWPNEVAGFKEVKGYDPTVIDVVTGSYDVRNHGYAVVFFVHKQNPLSGLTLPQLDAAFSLEHLKARTWGDLGATGAWKDRPIHLYGLPIARGFAAYLEDAVFGGSRLWNPDIREFADRPGEIDGGQLMLDAMAKDPDALGYAGALYHNDQVKPLALARRPGEPFVAASEATVTDHSYPLIRMISMVLDKAPGKKADPKLDAFIRYILSQPGQESVVKDGAGYLPMTPPFAARELKKLE
jgi:phosphate transport system substrate-binding protein